jgi:hypothetical protein
MSIFLGETVIKTFCASDCNQPGTAQRQVATQSLLWPEWLARHAALLTEPPVTRQRERCMAISGSRAPRGDSVSAIDLAKRRSLSGLDKILLACRHGFSSPAQEPNASVDNGVWYVHSTIRWYCSCCAHLNADQYRLISLDLTGVDLAAFPFTMQPKRYHR